MDIKKTGIQVDTTEEFENPVEFELNGDTPRVNAEGLEPDTEYYVRSYVVVDGRKNISDEVKTVTTKGDDFEYFYIQNESDSQNTITLHSGFDPENRWSGYDMESSTDGENWSLVTFNESNNFEVNLEAGEKVYFRSTSGFSGSEDDRYTFGGSNQFSANGCIYSLINYSQHPDTWEHPNQLPGRCFVSMFEDATNLVDASNLSFKGIHSTEFKSCACLFLNCVNLTTAPDMSTFVNVDVYGFEAMFKDAVNLILPPDLNSLATIARGGLSQFMSGCRALQQYPDFSHVVYVGELGLNEAFVNVADITDGPNISNVTTVGNYAFQSWCSNGSVTTLIAPNVQEWNNTAMSNWAGNDLPGEGVVIARESLVIPTDSNSGIPTGWSKQNAEPKRGGDTNDYFYFHNLTDEDGDIYIVWRGTPDPGWSEYDIYYSYDKENWTLYHASSENNDTIFIPGNGTVYMRGVNLGGLGRWEDTYSNSFYMNKAHEVGGNPLSLYNYGDMINMTNMGRRCLFENMFEDDTYLMDASKLNFQNVKELLPDSIFKRLFANCINLQSVPDTSNFTNVGQSSLYQTFVNCQQITEGIDLSNVTTANYNGFIQIYNGCSNLSIAYAPNVESWNAYEWLDRVAAEGVVYANPNCDLSPDSISGIPTGWTREDY